jgi:uncharacterized membrane protein
LARSFVALIFSTICTLGSAASSPASGTAASPPSNCSSVCFGLRPGRPRGAGGAGGTAAFAELALASAGAALPLPLSGAFAAGALAGGVLAGAAFASTLRGSFFTALPVALVEPFAFTVVVFFVTIVSSCSGRAARARSQSHCCSVMQRPLRPGGASRILQGHHWVQLRLLNGTGYALGRAHSGGKSRMHRSARAGRRSRVEQASNQSIAPHWLALSR